MHLKWEYTLKFTHVTFFVSCYSKLYKKISVACFQLLSVSHPPKEKKIMKKHVYKFDFF